MYMQFYSETRYALFVGYFSGVPAPTQKQVNGVFLKYHLKFPLSRVGGGRNSNGKTCQRLAIHKNVFPALLLPITMLASVSLLYLFPTSPPSPLRRAGTEWQAKEKTNIPAPNTIQALARRHFNNIPNFFFSSHFACLKGKQSKKAYETEGQGGQLNHNYYPHPDFSTAPHFRPQKTVTQL